jgi:glutathione S-transferase
MAAAAAAPLLKLFTSPGSRAQIIEFAAQELGAAISLVPCGDRNAPAYRAVHPFGKLPAAVAPDGTPIFESGAILLYLADAAGATPTPGARARAAKWVLWANASFWPAAEHSRRAPPAMLADLEAVLAAQPFLDGGAFSVADVAVGSYLHYCGAFFGEKFAACPKVAAYVAAVRARPAFKSTIGAE